MKLTIDRKLWARGNVAPNLLLEEDGKMCCLGFLAKKCGAKKEDLVCKAAPEELPNLRWPKGILKHGTNSELCSSIIYHNDKKPLSDSEREKQLKELFKEIKVDVSFVG